MGDDAIVQAWRAEIRTAAAMRDAWEALLWARCATAHAFGLPIDEIADFMGVSRATVYRRLRLVDEDGRE